MFLASYKHFVCLSRRIVSRLLAITIALSFFATLAPVVSASLDKPGVMACCIGKEEGHCHSGLTGHKPPTEANAGAESNAKVESASISRPCPMNCGACTASTSRLQKRQKEVIQARKFHASAPATSTRFAHLSRVSTANESWTHINSRGPPATRL